jgi:uncharacterized protein YndB with AHSA1/START domain
MQKEIKKTWFFKQSPQEVWEYLTRPELIEQWLTKTDLQPVVGHKFRFLNKSGKIIDCEVLEVKTFSRLCYSWQYPSAKDRSLQDSKVEWTLIPKANGTELQLVHTGFITQEDLLAHENGWNICLKQFEQLINTN